MERGTCDIEVMPGPGYIWVGVGGHRRWNLLHFLGNLQVSAENPSYGGRVIGDFLCPLTMLNYCKKFVLINFNFRTVLNSQNYFKLIQKFPYTQYLVLPTFFFFFGHAAWLAGSYFPKQGSNPWPLQWKCRVLTTGPPGKT